MTLFKGLLLRARVAREASRIARAQGYKRVAELSSNPDNAMRIYLQAYTNVTNR